MYFSLFVGVLCLCLFCNALLCVHSSFAIVLKRKRERKLFAMLLLSYRYIVTINVTLLILRCRGLVYSVLWWYFLIILTYFLGLCKRLRCSHTNHECILRKIIEGDLDSISTLSFDIIKQN